MDTTVPGNTPSNSGMSGNTEGALNKASSSAHAVVNSIAGVADDAARKAKPAIDHVAAMAHQAVDRAADAAAPAADWLTEKGDSLNTTKKKMVQDTCGYVSANPLKAVGIAAIVGFLLSRMIR